MPEDTAQLTSALADRYRVDGGPDGQPEVVGRGGMAVVYRAWDIRHQRHVAVKVLHGELSALIGSSRFLTEIRVTAKLQHPHIVPLLDSGAGAGAEEPVPGR
jgi:serine/threonine protein kinase